MVSLIAGWVRYSSLTAADNRDCGSPDNDWGRGGGGAWGLGIMRDGGRAVRGGEEGESDIWDVLVVAGADTLLLLPLPVLLLPPTSLLLPPLPLRPPAPLLLPRLLAPPLLPPPSLPLLPLLRRLRIDEVDEDVDVDDGGEVWLVTGGDESDCEDWDMRSCGCDNWKGSTGDDGDCVTGISCSTMSRSTNISIASLSKSSLACLNSFLTMVSPVGPLESASSCRQAGHCDDFSNHVRRQSTWKWWLHTVS